jgi:hypothetical protein
VLSLIHTLYTSLQHPLILLSLLSLHLSSPGNGFQRHSFVSSVFHSSGPRWLALISQLTLQSSLKGYSSRPHSSRTALPNRCLKTVLLCPWPPSQGPGPPAHRSIPPTCRSTASEFWTVTCRLTHPNSTPVTTLNCSVVQFRLQSYFTPGGLPPVSSSWCQASWG